MDIHGKLRQLMADRNWTEYRLAKECGLSQTTIYNIMTRNTIPNFFTLETICSAFGITVSQFFAEGDMVEMTPELKELFNGWANLTVEQKQAVQHVIQAMNHDQ
ncbi:MAG: helix-turn-helix transcriptional regulator [Clostridia bacterium]|nr:helix-turn-helix transcriptional regulator [Clostridia bacterium]